MQQFVGKACRPGPSLLHRRQGPQCLRAQGGYLPLVRPRAPAAKPYKSGPRPSRVTPAVPHLHLWRGRSARESPRLVAPNSSGASARGDGVIGRSDGGQVASAELPFAWSDVAQDFADMRAGDSNARSSFKALLRNSGERAVRVYGTFNPARLTCTTAYSELRGTRHQFVLGQIASIDELGIELRPIVIAMILRNDPAPSDKR